MNASLVRLFCCALVIYLSCSASFLAFGRWGFFTLAAGAAFSAFNVSGVYFSRDVSVPLRHALSERDIADAGKLVVAWVVLIFMFWATLAFGFAGNLISVLNNVSDDIAMRRYYNAARIRFIDSAGEAGAFRKNSKPMPRMLWILKSLYWFCGQENRENINLIINDLTKDIRSMGKEGRRLVYIQLVLSWRVFGTIFAIFYDGILGVLSKIVRVSGLVAKLRK